MDFHWAYGVDLLATYGYKLYKLDFETPWTHDGLWVHESVMARAGLLAIDPRAAFLERPAYLYHIEAAPKAVVESWRVREDYEIVRAENLVRHARMLSSEARTYRSAI